jgi:CysZ protein
MFTAFPRGLYAHVRGFRFAMTRKGYMALALIPFALTIVLYVVGFGLFAANGDRLLGLFWSPEAAASTGLAGVLYWFYAHVVKYLLYLLAFVLMYFLFMVTANILAAPLYDSITGRMAREASGADTPQGSSLPFWRSILEEAKKAVFVAAFPLLLAFVPIVGQILAPIAAAVLLAFDFVDFSLCRDQPRFTGRLRYMVRNPLLLLGFGLPLLIPIANIFIFPFAILGSTLLYLETTGRSLPPKQQK